MLMEERTPLIQELKEERRKCSKQEEKIVEMLKMLDSLQEVMEFAAPREAFSNLPGGQEPSPDDPFCGSGPRF